MERSRMPDSTSSDSARVPITALPDVPDLRLGPWSDRAICVHEDPALFFPPHGDPADKARQICAECPARIDCLDYAIDAGEFGIWGGLDQEQRRILFHERMKSPKRSQHVKFEPGESRGISPTKKT
jgi:WhiB family transcriptional regulator, redox-sensing transcriptional regulator